MPLLLKDLHKSELEIDRELATKIEELINNAIRKFDDRSKVKSTTKDEKSKYIKRMNELKQALRNLKL